jgi:nicotinate-nucleotide adenylyltransferase
MFEASGSPPGGLSGTLHSALMSRRIGVMGGTFDPIHHGHLVAAEEARWQFGLHQVVFVPTGRPWQKPVGVSPAEDRYQMTVIATASNPAFTVSRLEIDHHGPTYTVDTLRRLRAGLAEGTRLYFIIGADTMLQILTWKEPDQVLAQAEFLAASRPDFDLDSLVNQLPGAAGRVHRMEIPALAISSSDIRARVARSAPIRYLVPDGVARYIQEHALYRTPTVGDRPDPPASGHGNQ